MSNKNCKEVCPDNLYSKKGYCEKKGITRPTLDRWIKQGKVKTIAYQGGKGAIAIIYED